MSVKKNLDQVIISEIKESIMYGAWTPGQRIDVKELAEKYGVSKTPIIQAIKVIVNEGMLTMTTTGKIFVPIFTKSEMEDIYEVRLLLELHAISVICEDKSIKIDHLEYCANKCSEYVREGDPVKGREMDLEFHKTIVSLCGNTYLADIYSRVQGQYGVSNYLLTTFDDAVFRKSYNEHYIVLAALHERNYEKAAGVLRTHVERGLEQITLLLSD